MRRDSGTTTLGTAIAGTALLAMVPWFVTQGSRALSIDILSGAAFSAARAGARQPTPEMASATAIERARRAVPPGLCVDGTLSVDVDVRRFRPTTDVLGAFEPGTVRVQVSCTTNDFDRRKHTSAIGFAPVSPYREWR